jgi:hypothetical protein
VIAQEMGPSADDRSQGGQRIRQGAVAVDQESHFALDRRGSECAQEALDVATDPAMPMLVLGWSSVNDEHAAP